MSEYTYIISDSPLAEVRNPLIKLFSINEAAAQGIEIPKMLSKTTDRDEPGVILWTASEDNFDEIEIYDNSPFFMQDLTNAKYASVLQWRYSEDRAKQIITYMQTHLETANSIELLRFWLDSENKVEGNINPIHFNINDLTVADVEKYMWKIHAYETPVWIVIKGDKR